MAWAWVEVSEMPLMADTLLMAEVICDALLPRTLDDARAR